MTVALAVGIDLGTTNTVIAAVRDDVVATLSDAEGERLLPSVVSFHPSGSVMVGRTAVERRLMDPANTIYSIKRLIGRPWGSPTVQQVRGKLPFELREGPKGGTLVAARGEAFSLPEISAFVLRQAKAIADAALGEPVERAVVTVPANFNDLQRAATKTAGRLAGLDVLRIINEPTAAALAYGPQGREQERVAVYDLGGGTFDVTLLDLAGNVFEVLATAGDTALGGDDIDLIVAERMADELLKRHRFDARSNPIAFARLRILAERMKRELSTLSQRTIEANDLVPGDRGSSVPWQFRLTRPELEWMSLAIVERTFKVCQEALDSAGVQPGELSRIILVGGATRMPMIARKAEQFFGRTPVMHINPDEVVALGAAVQAMLLDRSRQSGGGQATHPRISPESVVGPLPTAEVEDDLPELPGVVAARSPQPSPPPPAPVSAAEVLHAPSGRPLVFDVPAPELDLPPPPPLPPPLANPQAKPKPPPPARPRPAPLLIDVTPLSLGVETVGGYCDVLIEANTPVPCDRTRSFSTASDGQTAVEVRVAQGVSKRFQDNTLLGEIQLTGIPAAPRGEAHIAVTFEIDADGILNVRARDARTGHQTQARIQLVGAQTDPADIEAMRARQAAHPLAALGSAR
jgi:molecular chaperone DnaK